MSDLGNGISSCLFVHARLETFKLRTARAFAASVVLPEGRMWILGGAGEEDLLASTEYVRGFSNGADAV